MNKHVEYLEMLIGPLAGEGGGGGITPTGSVTLTKNTSPSGVDVADKALAIVSVQGGLDYDYVPYIIPSEYPEYPCVENKTREQIETYDPEGVTTSRFWVVWDEAHPPLPAQNAKVAITGVTSDTHDPYMVLATTAGSPTQGEGELRLRVVYDAAPTFGVGNPVMDITANGNGIDVKGRNAVNVNVPSVQPTGSVTIKQNTDNNGVDVSNKAKAIVEVAGGVDYNFVQPYIPSGYTEVKMPTSLKSTTVSGYTAGQTNKQVSAPLPLWFPLNNGDKIAITGITTDTYEKFCVAGTVSGKSTYTNYQYAKLTIDYNGMLGSAAVVPTGYTEAKAMAGKSASQILAYTAGTAAQYFTLSHDVSVAVGDKLALTGLTNDTGDEFCVAGTVTSTSQSTTSRTIYMNIDYNGMVGVTAPTAIIKANGTVDVKGRGSAMVDVHGTGTILIEANGQVTVDGYKYANVAVPIPTGGNVLNLDGFVNVEYFQASYNNPNQGITAIRMPNAEGIAQSLNYFANLLEVYIGKDIRTINYSFDNCPSLQAIAFDDHLLQVPTASISYLPSDTKIYVPDGLVAAFQQDYNWQQHSSKICPRTGMPWSETFAPFYQNEIVTYNNVQYISLSDNNTGVPGTDPTWDVYI